VGDLEAYIGRYRWPAFNVADAAISIGAFLLLVDMAFPRANESSPGWRRSVARSSATERRNPGLSVISPRVPEGRLISPKRI
jgi:hypothetical protein